MYLASYRVSVQLITIIKGKIITIERGKEVPRTVVMESWSFFRRRYCEGGTYVGKVQGPGEEQ